MVHGAVVKGNFIEEDEIGDIPRPRHEFVIEADDIVELDVDGSAFQFLVMQWVTTAAIEHGRETSCTFQLRPAA